MLDGVARESLKGGVTFLEARARQVLGTWRAGGAPSAAGLPVVSVGVMVTSAGPPIVAPSAGMLIVLQQLKDLVGPMTDGRLDVDDPGAHEAIADLREVLEAATGSRIAFAGEAARSDRAIEIDAFTMEVAARLPDVKARVEQGMAARASHGNDNLKIVYDQICTSYRAVDEARFRLLGLLPLATGAGLAIANPAGDEALGLEAPIGLFGVAVTLGLFSYELHGIKKCAYLINAGSLIERQLRIYGQFVGRPHSVAGFIDEPFAASVIYPASLAAWAVFTVHAALSEFAVALVALAALVFLGGLLLSTLLIRRMEADITAGEAYRTEPYRTRPGDPPRHLPRDAFDLPPLPPPTPKEPGALPTVPHASRS